MLLAGTWNWVRLVEHVAHMGHMTATDTILGS